MTRVRPGVAGRAAVRPGLVLAGLLLLAANLRAALVGYPPLLEMVRDALGISAGAAGLVQACAVVMMGVGSFLTPRLAGRVGWERLLTWSIVVLAAGSVLRGVAALPALLAGSVLVGLGIGGAGVLVTGVVKRHLAERAGAVTGAWVVSMMAGATVTSALAVPLAVGLGGWSFSLAVWAVPALLAAGAWWPVGRRFGRSPGGRRADTALPWRDGFARLATWFMAMTSLQFYGWLTWLSPYYQHLGWPSQRAALLQALWSVAQIPVALLVPALAERRRRWVFWTSLTLGCGIVGTLGVLIVPLPPVIGPWLWVALGAVGVGGGFALGLSVIAWRSPDAARTGAVSGLALGVGYLTAGIGPLLMGLLLDLTGAYVVPLSVLVLAGACQAAATYLIGDGPRQPRS
ncbi:MFS transporter [Pseudonocardia acaciae]|uniref:MFS transporter n=1 Tax=Pseudonocardia acaciae TaxID=551276 RepID=UPI001FDF27AE|nr:MFS transporter [Pseudonocardia acaciae]